MDQKQEKTFQTDIRKGPKETQTATIVQDRQTDRKTAYDYILSRINIYAVNALDGKFLKEN